MSTARTKIAVAFATGRGVTRWHERDAESPVPGAWPYGLDGLANASLELTAVELDPVGRVDRLRRRLPFPTVSRRPRAEIALTWDESLAEPLAHGAVGARTFCGVIWATENTGGNAASADALRRMTGLWVLSRPQVDLVRDWLGPDCPPVHFLPFGIDAKFYAATPYPDGPPQLVSIGGDRDRDATTLFAALDAVLRERPDVRMVVQTTSESTAPKGVVIERFIPHDRVRRLYAESTVVALATRPNVHASGMTVALEAMSSARPVVACDTPGMSDYVIDGVTGFLVPTNDPDSLARRVLELLADRHAAAAMGARGRDHVEQGFTTDTMCAALTRILTDDLDVASTALPADPGIAT